MAPSNRSLRKWPAEDWPSDDESFDNASRLVVASGETESTANWPLRIVLSAAGGVGLLMALVRMIVDRAPLGVCFGYLIVPVICIVGVWCVYFVYFLPALVAKSRNHPNAEAIRILNLCLGWTFLGWVIALVWAHTQSNS